MGLSTGAGCASSCWIRIVATYTGIAGQRTIVGTDLTISDSTRAEVAGVASGHVVGHRATVALIGWGWGTEGATAIWAGDLAACQPISTELVAEIAPKASSRGVTETTLAHTRAVVGRTGGTWGGDVVAGIATGATGVGGRVDVAVADDDCAGGYYGKKQD